MNFYDLALIKKEKIKFDVFYCSLRFYLPKVIFNAVCFFNAYVHCLMNRPFYQYGGHIELIRFKEYYRMPRGMSTFRLYFRALFGTFFLKVFLE